MMLKRYEFKENNNFVPMSDFSKQRRDDFNSVAQELVDLECLVCGDNNYRKISEIDRYGFYYPTGLCQRCGNVQQSKYYDEQTLTLFYEQYYRDIYNNQPPDGLFHDQIKQGEKILEFVGSKLAPNASVLEVGTGAGGILKAFKDGKNCRVTGLDYDDRYIEYGASQGVKIIKGGFEALPEGEKFDFIIISHVLEHVVDIAEFLGHVKMAIKPGGAVYIEVPSLNQVSEGGYEYNLLRYFQNAHVIHFSIDTLNSLLRKNGFRVCKMDSFIHCVCEVDPDQAKVGQSDASAQSDYRGMYQRQVNLLDTIERQRKSIFRKIKAQIHHYIIGIFVYRIVVRALDILGIKGMVKALLGRS